MSKPDLKIGKREDFHSDRCYKRYLYAVFLAKQVNKFIEQGCSVEVKGEKISPFIFTDNGLPCVAEKTGSVTFSWIRTSIIGTKLVMDDTKKELKKRFKKIQIYKKDLQKLIYYE